MSKASTRCAASPPTHGGRSTPTAIGSSTTRTLLRLIARSRTGPATTRLPLTRLCFAGPAWPTIGWSTRSSAALSPAPATAYSACARRRRKDRSRASARVDRLPRNEARFVAAEERDHVGDVLRLSGAAEGRLRCRAEREALDVDGHSPGG